MVRIEYTAASGMAIAAGLLYKPGVGVYISAPIVRFMSGWHLNKVLDHCKTRNWDYTLYDNDGKVVPEKELEGEY
jgi:hypothetical protein